MPNIKALRDQRAEKAKEARNLLDANTGDKWSKDIENQVDKIYEEIDRIDAQIARAEKQAKIDGDAAADDNANENRERNLSNMTQSQREQATRYNNAFNSFLLRGISGMTSDEVAALRDGTVQNAQSGQQGNGAAGGYLVPSGWGGELLEALKAFGGMRAVANVIRTNSGASLPWPTVDETGIEGELIPENASATDQDATFGTISLGSRKYSSKVFTIPFELLQDQGPGIDIEAFVRRAAATRIARITNRHFTVGTGVGQPEGIVTASAAGKVGATGKAASFDTDDLIDLEHSVDPAYRELPTVGFMFHDNTLRFLKKMKDAEGRPLWTPGLSVKEPDVLMGYRYTINQAMPQMAANAKSVLFGDLFSYMIRDIMEVLLFRFDDSAYTKMGQVGFLAWSRHDGKLVTAGQPVKHFQHSAA